MNTSTKLSSVTASALLKNSYIKVSKSSICDLLKKIPCLRSVIFSNSWISQDNFFQKSKELDSWITQALSLQIEEVETYVNGLLSDIDAVKNAIKYKYNNGLAEGSVNKI